MPLTPGIRLGSYEIVSPIGAGGMGEVYRARDTKLDRDVAIKVLPEAFANEAERLARFEREAQLLASLNHPNIASIYGFESGALVLELVEGPTLAERIAQGPVSVDEAIAIAKQIAEALEAGHEAGVIHRDLKPANIKLKEDGTVKVLDYGLAKAFEGDAPAGHDSELSQSPTLTRQGTQIGVILGTAAYMSPEQAKGKRVDKRSDIWAFSAVMYEMLTGKRAFPGEDVSDTLAAVLRAEPDWDALPADLSPTLRTYLARCLEKDPKRRVRDIGDVSLAFEGAFETAAPQPNPTSGRHVGWAALAAALAFGGIATGIAVWSLKPEPVQPLVRVVATPPSAEPLDIATGTTAATVNLTITSEGNRIIYPVNVSGRRELMVRALDQLETSTLTRLEGTRGQFVSPDGNWVGFADMRGNLRKVSILGGPTTVICELPQGAPQGASWGSDDTIVFATSGPSGLWRVPATGGEPEEITTPTPGQGDHLWPEILPSGDVLFTTMSGRVENAQVAVWSRETGDVKILIPGGSNPHYTPTGHIVYGVASTLRAATFDLERLEVTSDPVLVLDDVITRSTGAAEFDISDNGSLVYIAGDTRAEQNKTLVWVDREGHEEAITAEPRNYYYPRISPDGTQVAIDVRDQEDDIWIWDFARETLRRFTFAPGADRYAAWTPDGRHLAFGSARDGRTSNLFWKASDGTGSVERLTTNENIQSPNGFSPDGKLLLYREVHPQRGSDLQLLAMDGTGSVESFLGREFTEQNPEISPDGRWVAYETDASGQFEVIVSAFPNANEGSWQISTGGGTRPLWSRDSRELFYLDPDERLMSVSIRTEPSFDHGAPHVILEQAYGGGTIGRTYDVSPDGKHFLMIKDGAASDGNRPELILVLNWFQELKRLAPIKD